MRTFRIIFHSLLALVAALLLAVVVGSQLPAVQQALGRRVSSALSKELGSEVKIERIALSGWLQLSAHHFSLNDEQHDLLLNSDKLEAQFNPWQLIRGRVRIALATIEQPTINLYERPDGKWNYQFVIDKLVSDSDPANEPLDLKVANLNIRNGQLSYRPTVAKGNPVRLDDVNAQLSLKELTSDGFRLRVRHLSLKMTDGDRMPAGVATKSAFSLSDMSFDLQQRGDTLTMTDARIELPHSQLTAQFSMVQSQESRVKSQESDVQRSSSTVHRSTFNVQRSMLKVDGYLTPTDISRFVQPLSHLNDKVNLSTQLTLKSQADGTTTIDAPFNISDPLGSYHVEGRLDHSPATSQLQLNQLFFSEAAVSRLANAFKDEVKVPEESLRLGSIRGQGMVNKTGNSYLASAQLQTGIGDVHLEVKPVDSQQHIEVSSSGLNVGRLLNTNLVSHVQGDARLTLQNGEPRTLHAQLAQLTVQGKTYHNITLDGQQQANGEQWLHLVCNDPKLKGEAQLQRMGDNMTLQLDDIVAQLDNGEPLQLCHLNLEQHAGSATAVNHLQLTSDFGQLNIDGRFNYNDLHVSFTNAIRRYLPTLPWLPAAKKTNNTLHLSAQLNDSRVLSQLFDLDLNAKETITLEADIDDAAEQFNAQLQMPDATIGQHHLRDAHASITTTNGILQTLINLQREEAPGETAQVNLHASAHDNKLSAQIVFSSNYGKHLKGLINTQTNFSLNPQGLPTANIRVLPSDIVIEDTIWKVRPAQVEYCKDYLTVKNLAIAHGKQHIQINGSNTRNADDSIQINLQRVNVAYIMDLVNFHSVEFDGQASGTASLTHLFQKPTGKAHLNIADFRFERGRMGTLQLDAHLDEAQERILVTASATDGPFHRLDIDGYVSPKENYIDLALDAQNTPAEFLQKICGSFMDNVDMTATGQVNLCGPLNDIGLIGQLKTNGSFLMKPFGATYRMESTPITFMPYTFKFEADTLRDQNNHMALIDGSIRHRNLGHLIYDLHVQLQDFQVFNFPEVRENTFSGTVSANGDCHIHGNDNDLVVDIDITPSPKSQFTYNASAPDQLSETSFISWNDITPNADAPTTVQPITPKVQPQMLNIGSDLHVNFLINTNPNATLKVIMDNETGDYIALNGDGVLRCSYYNNGPFHIYGNYLVDHGIYKLTIQNIIKKDFQIQSGGTIAFGGEPYEAPINLQAQYTVNGVSMADLHVGRSFSNNNIRVNCLMNITGTPNEPKVDFGLEFPSLGTDARRMVNSLINSQEEMNQQVLYLLAIGRFYSQGNNNADGENTQTQSQTSLAMQSLLSGTISQQINNVLSSVVNNTNWNFGANISTGDEGWNNAEYEGILSGRMLNNRLLFNGQFGYRDNANATTSFIGDFDLRYLLYPNGNIAIRVYNETSDRYFTKNSLNTQGIGLIIKKDFTSWRDLLGIKQKKSNTAPVDSIAPNDSIER